MKCRRHAFLALCIFLGVRALGINGLRVERSRNRAIASQLAFGGDPNAVTTHILGPPSFAIPSGYDKMVRPYKNIRPDNVSLGLRVRRIAEVNEKDGSVLFDLVVLTTWVDPRLAGITLKRIAPKDVWLPGLFVSNQGSEPEWLTSELVLQLSGKLIYERRVVVTVEHTFELEHFPFDHHHIPITVNAFGYDADEVVLSVDQSVKSALLSDSTWDLQTFRVDSDVRKTMMSPRQSVVEGTLVVKRELGMILSTILLPLILIVLFTFLSFFVWEQDFYSRIIITSIGFLTVMAFMYVVNEELPRIAYLTWMHWYMLVCFLMTFVVNCHVTAVHFFHPVGETKMEKKKRLYGIGIKEIDDDEDDSESEGEDDVETPLLGPDETFKQDPDVIMLQEKLKEAIDHNGLLDDDFLSADAIVTVSNFAGFPVTARKANIWIQRNQKSQHEELLSIDIFLQLMAKELVTRRKRRGRKKRCSIIGALREIGYSSTNASRMDSKCRLRLPCLFFVITALMLLVEVSNITYRYQSSKRIGVKVK